MEVYEAVHTVLAVREFQSEPVPDSVVYRIIESARLTGSSMNAQPWHFVVVQNRDTLRELGSLVSSGRYNAQAAFAVVVAIDKSSPFGISDATRAIQSMVLTAWSESIGSNWTGWVGMTEVASLSWHSRKSRRYCRGAFRLSYPNPHKGQEAVQEPIRTRSLRAIWTVVRLTVAVATDSRYLTVESPPSCLPKQYCTRGSIMQGWWLAVPVQRRSP